MNKCSCKHSGVRWSWEAADGSRGQLCQTCVLAIGFQWDLVALKRLDSEGYGLTMDFHLDAKEVAAYDVWDKAHVAEHHGGKEPYAGAIGGRVSFAFTSTGLGIISSAKCGLCRNKPDSISTCVLTNFDEW